MAFKKFQIRGLAVALVVSFAQVTSAVDCPPSIRNLHERDTRLAEIATQVRDLDRRIAGHRAAVGVEGTPSERREEATRLAAELEHDRSVLVEERTSLTGCVMGSLEPEGCTSWEEAPRDRASYLMRYTPSLLRYRATSEIRIPVGGSSISVGDGQYIHLIETATRPMVIREGRVIYVHGGRFGERTVFLRDPVFDSMSRLEAPGFVLEMCVRPEIDARRSTDETEDRLAVSPRTRGRPEVTPVTNPVKAPSSRTKSAR